MSQVRRGHYQERRVQSHDVSPPCDGHMCWRCMETFESGTDVYPHMEKEHGGMTDVEEAEEDEEKVNDDDDDDEDGDD